MFGRGFAALVLALCVFTGSFAAKAGTVTGYLCDTYFSTGFVGYGTLGYVATSVYTGPNCSGSFLQTAVLCSTGATSSLCYFKSTYWAKDTLSLMSQYQILATATMNGSKVRIETGECKAKPTDTTCASTFSLK